MRQKVRITVLLTRDTDTDTDAIVTEKATEALTVYGFDSVKVEKVALARVY